MRSNVDTATAAQLTARRGLVPRNFVWIEAKDRDTGAVQAMGLWNGEDTVSISVISGSTGVPVTRTYFAAGALLNVDPIPLTTDLSVRSIRISLSQINAAVQQLVRGYDVRKAPVEVHRGLLDIDTRNLVAPPLPRFVGRVNKAPITTPAAGGEGGISVTCVSDTRALTFVNPLLRSDEYQKTRSGDRFRRYTDVAGQIEIFWGEKKGKAGTGSTVAQKLKVGLIR